MLAIDIREITDLQEYKDRVDDLFYKVRNSPPAPGFSEVMIPGEPERREKAKRLKEGIFIEDETW
ncbi:MAG: Ldh family oxidoreductase, partial [Candidatus Thorarchaeota archaeon]|nr:Ldh family oxidoreductase [Candidatus Thorarchaeota archaeon]NIW53360.1 Ldh family oxidoreductase [Candidatus Korarchaeota archaeon]